MIMPGGNGTGPMGWGPMSGRRAGYCAGYGVPGCLNSPGGRGAGLGRGAGFGRGAGLGRGGGMGPVFPAASYGFNPQAAWSGVTAEQEQAALKNQLAHLEQLSANLRQRLSDFENPAESEK